MAKKAQFGALLKSLKSLYKSQKNQKQLKYMPIPGRYLRKTFECIRYMGNLMGTKKASKSRGNCKKQEFGAILKLLQCLYVSHRNQK